MTNNNRTTAARYNMHAAARPVAIPISAPTASSSRVVPPVSSSRVPPPASSSRVSSPAPPAPTASETRRGIPNLVESTYVNVVHLDSPEIDVREVFGALRREVSDLREEMQALRASIPAPVPSFAQNRGRNVPGELTEEQKEARRSLNVILY